MKFDLNNPRTLATTGIMTALVLGLTLIHIGVTPTGGYVHLGDIAVYFTAFAFGPWAGLVAGGLGAGLADVVSGYATFAPLSLIVHGAQGFVAGWIAYKNPTPARLALAILAGNLILVGGFLAWLVYLDLMPTSWALAILAGDLIVIGGYSAWAIYKKDSTPVRLGLAILAGGLIVIGGYFAGESLVSVLGGSAAALGEIPGNVIQEAFGALGVVVYLAVTRAYPRLRSATQEAR